MAAERAELHRGTQDHNPLAWSPAASPPRIQGCATCSATLDDRQTSTLWSRNGSTDPMPARRSPVCLRTAPAAWFPWVGSTSDVVPAGVGECRKEWPAPPPIVEHGLARWDRAVNWLRHRSPTTLRCRRPVQTNQPCTIRCSKRNSASSHESTSARAPGERLGDAHRFTHDPSWCPSRSIEIDAALPPALSCASISWPVVHCPVPSHIVVRSPEWSTPPGRPARIVVRPGRSRCHRPVRSVLLLCWRDTGHRRLGAADLPATHRRAAGRSGSRVTLRTARYPGALRRGSSTGAGEPCGGGRYYRLHLRRPGRRRPVGLGPAAASAPTWSSTPRTVCRSWPGWCSAGGWRCWCTTVTARQWPVAGRFVGRLGCQSRLSPRLHRATRRYVTVSLPSARDLTPPTSAWMPAGSPSCATASTPFRRTRWTPPAPR